jgi:penicillin-binding protein 1C
MFFKRCNACLPERTMIKIRAFARRRPLLCFFLAGIASVWMLIYAVVPRRLFVHPYSTMIYSREGELLGARIATDGQWRFPPADSVPHKFATCLVACEDKRFRFHRGIDPLALLRAMSLNLARKKVVSGGSTITMQIARLARGQRQRTFREKIAEAICATYLEMIYSKRHLLLMYSSHAPFGGNVVGVETAAWRYFGRGAADLSWSEAAMLASLPNSPALIHPGRNRERLKAKRDRLLLTLKERNLIDATEYELACMEKLPDAPARLPDDAPHILERMAASTPGQRLTTTLNSSWQRRTQDIVNRYAKEYAANHVYNIAAIIADVETGEILAYSGNATDLGHGRKGKDVDIVTSPRSTGSLLKPFLYAAMLDDGMITPNMLVADVPLNINGFTPQNFSRTYHGVVPARRAIEQSLNVPLVRMLTTYNTGRFMTLLKNMGMTTLRFSELHYGASIILGGAEGSLWDMTGMYASLGRILAHYHRYNGRYNPMDVRPLSFMPVKHDDISSISDSRLRDHSVISAASAWFTFEAMSALNRPEEESEWQQFSSMKQIAWKTGTSYGSRDAWAIGLNTRHAVGVWVGNASGEGRPGVTGVGYAAPVLFDIFSFIPDGEWFDKPYDELENVGICRHSGHRASLICPSVDSVYIPSSAMRSAVCPYHRIVHLSADGRHRVNATCAGAGGIVQRSWFVLPPAQAYYYRSNHIDYLPLPPFMPGCEHDAVPQIEVLYPENNTVLYLPKGFSGELEKFIFRAAHSRSDAVIYWHIDDQYLGETRTSHQISCRISSGAHQLTLVDGLGNKTVSNFVVR